MVVAKSIENLSNITLVDLLKDSAGTYKKLFLDTINYINIESVKLSMATTKNLEGLYSSHNGIISSMYRSSYKFPVCSYMKIDAIFDILQESYHIVSYWIVMQYSKKIPIHEIANQVNKVIPVIRKEILTILFKNSEKLTNIRRIVNNGIVKKIETFNNFCQNFRKDEYNYHDYELLIDKIYVLILELLDYFSQISNTISSYYTGEDKVAFLGIATRCIWDDLLKELKKLGYNKIRAIDEEATIPLQQLAERYGMTVY